MAAPTASYADLDYFRDPVIQALTQGSRWTLGPSRQITWATADNPYFSIANPSVAALDIANALGQIEAVINVDFVYAGHFSYAPYSTADITYSIAAGALATGMFASGGLAQAVFPYAPLGDSFSVLMTGTVLGYPYAEGDVWLNAPAMIAQGYTGFWDGAAGKFVLLHETGHALGLKHPHDGGGTGRPTFADIGLSADTRIEFTQGDGYDVDAFTVMSYNDDLSLNLWSGDPATLMPLDVIALQAMYGPNVTTNQGNSTHLIWRDGTLTTTWDAGGDDTLDGSLSDAGWAITLSATSENPHLAPHLARLALAIPLIGGVPDFTTVKWIFDAENAYGSNFADLLVGSNGANLLHGNGGDDFVNGQGGNDVLVGGFGLDSLAGGDGDDYLIGNGGNDVLDGGVGYDAGVWNLSASAYSLTFVGGQPVVTARMSDEGSDRLSGMELLGFSDKLVPIESRSHGTYADLPISLYHFFIVAFNAAPGVTYMDQLAEAYRYGLSVREITEIFTTKSQFTSVYPTTLSNAQMAVELVENIVKNSAGVGAKQSAVADIAGALDLGWTVGTVIYTVFGNLANKAVTDPTWGGTARQFQNEIAVARYYTEILNQSTDDLNTLRSVLAPVTDSTDVSSDAVVASLIGVALLAG